MSTDKNTYITWKKKSINVAVVMINKFWNILFWQVNEKKISSYLHTLCEIIDI